MAKKKTTKKKVSKAERIGAQIGREIDKGIKKEKCRPKKHKKDFCNGGIYGLGFIGAAVYYISTAPTFWTGVLGFLKALVWPAFLIYEALKFLGK